MTIISECILPMMMIVAHFLPAVHGADNVNVIMKPLLYCSDKRWWGCKTRSYPYGPYWNNAGMSEDNQAKAFMAIMGSIPANIKYIAVFSSGQQGSSGGSSGDSQNVVSGASDNWKWNTHENGEEVRTVNGLSVAGEFFGRNQNNNLLGHDNTLYLTIWDPQFNHMASSGEKDDTLEGYAEFLNSKVDWSNIEGVVLAGSSRGGCFAMRMAQKLRDKYDLSSVDFAIGSIDGVCKYTQNEFGTTSNTINNPVSSAPSSYKAYKTNVYNQFGDLGKFCVWHMAGGDEVAIGVHTFSHETCDTNCLLPDGNNHVFYEQTWEDICHTCAGRNFDATSLLKTVSPMLSHFEYCIQSKFGWNDLIII